MNTNTKDYNLEIIAGPCSITSSNAEEIINEVASITTPDGPRAIYGTRVVGLKSRTTLSDDGKGMGMDFDIINDSIELSEKDEIALSLPSVELAEKIAQKTGLLISTEIMIPHVQLPALEAKKSLRGNVMIWNPSVEQLGWNILEMANYAKRNAWRLGIKHGKFLGGDPLEVANHPDYKNETSLEKTLLGLTTFAKPTENDVTIIHRGVDVPGKGKFRNALIHEVMKRLKGKAPGCKLYFDPSHSFGPQMRNHIVSGIIEAMRIKVGDHFLYDGILIEAGTSPTDADQHITIAELHALVQELSKFRKLRAPKDPLPQGSNSYETTSAYYQ
jgi:3-deoxy-D-arabino-heptulosonate 7-phosphate (DAHP) synthase